MILRILADRLHFQRSQNRPGTMLLLAVLVLGSVAMAIVVSGALRGIGEVTMGTSESASKEAFAAADALAEEGLRKFMVNDAYTGESLAFGSAAGTISIAPTTGSLRTITATAVVDRWTARTQVRVDTTGAKVTVLWWRQL
ncbi:MAG: hypothetical protein WCG83_03360 [Candidatus Peregrinibacteria bacterium]